MKKITECRACGSKALTPVFSLPSPEPRFDALGRRKQGEAKFVLCDPSRDAGACGLLQSAYARTPAPEMFEPSGRYAVNRSHLRQLATEALEAISGRDCAALDIGCNDGAPFISIRAGSIATVSTLRRSSRTSAIGRGRRKQVFHPPNSIARSATRNSTS
ncbi:MAG: hypothetical protein R3C55_08380 [Parvularculaceae bacterium]